MAGDISDQTVRADGSQQACRVIVVGAQIAKRLREPGGFGDRVEVVTQCGDLREWLELPEEGERADLVVAECPTLFPETLESILKRTASAGALRAIVVYHFCQDLTREMMDQHSSDISALRAPVTAEDLKSACEADVALASIRGFSLQDTVDLSDDPIPTPTPEVEVEIPVRQFSDEALSELSRISTTVDCECPHHISTLVGALNAFEEYSRECENKNEKDALLHAYLHRRTARARAIMEDALVVLMEAEGIEIDQGVS